MDFHCALDTSGVAPPLFYSCCRSSKYKLSSSNDGKYISLNQHHILSVVCLGLIEGFEEGSVSLKHMFLVNRVLEYRGKISLLLIK